MIVVTLICLTLFFIYYGTKKPMAIPALYLLLSNFFVIDFNFFFLKLNTSKLFLFSILIFFLWSAFQQKFKFLQERSFLFLGSVYLISFIVPSLYHYYQFHYWPSLFFSPYLKSLWGLGFFTIPKEKRNLEQVLLFLLITFFISFLFIAPASVYFYNLTGEGLGRMFSQITAISNEAKWQRPFWQWFIMDDNTSENLSITMALFLPMILHFLLQYKKDYLPQKILFLYTIISPLIFYILLANQYMMCVMVYFFQWLLTTFHYRHLLKTHLSKRILLMSLCSCLMILTFIILKTTSLSFIKSRWTLTSSYQNSDNRISILVHKTRRWLQHSPFTGSGYPSSYETVQSEDTSTSGHSTILDQIIAFGLIFGLCSLFLYVYPIFMLFILRDHLHSPFLLSSLTAFFGTFIFISAETIFGREALQLGSILFIISCTHDFCFQKVSNPFFSSFNFYKRPSTSSLEKIDLTS